MKLILLTALFGLSLAACADPAGGPTAGSPTEPSAPRPDAQDANPSTPPIVGMANPASVHCGEVGGRLEIRDGADGQYGVCLFEDGRQCEEWALFRDNRCVAPEAGSGSTAGSGTAPASGARPATDKTRGA